jgi:UTP--glucose-1-phosphate uridylyltransferase
VFFWYARINSGYFSDPGKASAVINGNLQLTPALQELSEQDKYLALEVKGNRYDIGKKFGLLQAQIALGLAGQAHDQTLTTIVDSLAEATAEKAIHRVLAL